MSGTERTRDNSELRDLVHVSQGAGKRKGIYSRKYVELNGLRWSDHAYVVHNNSLINILRALVERVYFVESPRLGLVLPPYPRRAVFSNHMRNFKNSLIANLEPVRRMCLRTFVRTSPIHKRKVYEQAMKTYLATGLTEHDARVTSFIKAEKVSTAKSDPAPRIIQPRGVKFNLVYGCFIRPAEKEIYRAIDAVFGRPTVVCGQNAEQQATMLRQAWDVIADPIAISYDLSRMDQHVSDVALRWEHSIYRHMYKNDHDYDTLDWCLNNTVDNKGVAYTTDAFGVPHKVSYRKRGSRMSGDMNTSLGNKLLMCGMLHSYFTGHLGFVVGVDYAIVDNGDDCVVILSRRAYNRMQVMTTQRPYLFLAYGPNANEGDNGHWRNPILVEAAGVAPVPATHRNISVFFNELGFTLKEEGMVFDFEKIEFCQTQPCFIDGRWIMVRGLKALSKDCYCLKQFKQFEQWLSQVSSAGKTCYGSVPIFSAFYNCMTDKLSTDFSLMEQSGLYYLARDMKSTGVVTDENRISFYNTFGVTPGEQVLIEEHYRSMTRITYNEGPSVGWVLPM